MGKPNIRRFSALFQPGNIGRLRLKNRLIMAPMGNSLADGDGYVTEAMLDYYRARARGGVGLIITQLTSVSSDDMMPYSLAIYDDKFMPGMRRLVEAIHEQGAKVSIQLMHPGMLLLLLPSLPQSMTVKVPTITPWMVAKKPYQEVSQKDIERYVWDFAEAARRAMEVNADAVELHACHGCLLSTFLSPATNRRTDQYGGSVENRARFPQRTVMAIRQKVGSEFPLTVRINGNEDVEGGITADEVVQQAVILESAGADAISISSGLEYWSTLMAPPYSAPEGLNISVAEQVKKALKIPVITAGKIGPELAEQIVRDSKTDFIALGRPLLADAELPNKLRYGRLEDIRQCLYCNNCLRSIWRSCTVNPFLYKEAVLPLTPVRSPKRIMVVGGGLAGMQAAVLLAERGHHVSLHERDTELGGQWLVACAASGKQGFAAFINHLRRSLDRLDIPVALATEVTLEQVLVMKPDVVVVATGAIPQGLDVLRSMRCNVVQANDVIQSKIETNGRVVVIGGRMLGMEVAVLLAQQGKEVTLVSRSRLGGRKGPDEKITYRALMRRLVELRVPLYLNTSVLEITEDSVISRLEDEVLSLPADTVVVAIGVKPVDTLVEELQGLVPEVYPIGDCVQPGNAAQATFGAARLATDT